MIENDLVSPGSFCWNQDCPDYGEVNHGNMVKFGRTQKGIQRYRCKTCGKTFVETKGTVFYGRHHSQETILECLALLAERNSLAAIHRVKEETVSEWLREAAKHVEEIEVLLLARYRLRRAQLDALWTYVGHKGKRGHPEGDDRGTFWRGTVIDIDTRLRVGRAIEKDEERVSAALLAQLKTCGHPDAPPAIATDGKGGYRESMVETWGQVPEYAGRGRPPTRRQAQPDWHYLQVIKHHSGKRLTGITIKVIYGDPEEVAVSLASDDRWLDRSHLGC